MLKKIGLLFSILCLSCLTFAQSADQFNKTDEKGNKQGKWKQYYPMPHGGGLKYVGQFENDEPMGKFIFYFKSGAVKSITIYKEKGIARTEIYYETGALAAKGNFVQKKRDSTWLIFYPEGNVMAIRHYDVGKSIGTWKEFYKDGRSIAVKTSYENGVENGYFYMYTQSGQVTMKKTYKDGKLNGLAQFFYPDGQLHVKGNYKNDFKTGTWHYYNKDNDSVKTEIFIKGQPKDGPKIYPPDSVHLEKKQILQDKFSGFGGRNY